MKIRNEWKKIIIKALEEKTSEQKLELYPYFENLSSNRIIASIFQELTGVNIGTTNKRGLEAFDIVFGSDTRIKIERERKELKEKEKAEETKRKERKRNETLSMFSSHSSHIWDMDRINNLTPLQLGRVKKSLEKQFRFETGIKSLIEYINEQNPTGKSITNNMWKWNRKNVAKMSYKEEAEYEKKLKEGKTYQLKLDGVYFGYS